MAPNAQTILAVTANLDFRPRRLPHTDAMRTTTLAGLFRVQFHTVRSHLEGITHEESLVATEQVFRGLLPQAEASGSLSYHLELLTEVARVRYLLERGRAFNSSQKRGQAKPRFVKAWALLKGMGWLKDGEPERYARLARLAGATPEED